MKIEGLEIVIYLEFYFPLLNERIFALLVYFEYQMSLHSQIETS